MPGPGSHISGSRIPVKGLSPGQDRGGVPIGGEPVVETGHPVVRSTRRSGDPWTQTWDLNGARPNVERGDFVARIGSKNSPVRIVSTGGSVTVAAAYDRAELRAVLDGRMPRPRIKAKAKAKKSDSLSDAVAIVTRLPQRPSDGQRMLLGRAVATLRAKGGTHEEVTLRAVAFRRRWPGAHLNLRSLVARWDRLG